MLHGLVSLGRMVHSTGGNRLPTRVALQGAVEEQTPIILIFGRVPANTATVPFTRAATSRAAGRNREALLAEARSSRSHATVRWSRLRWDSRKSQIAPLQRRHRDETALNLSRSKEPRFRRPQSGPPARLSTIREVSPATPARPRDRGR